jgi:DNA (cytosine-5)-methyltransferase 1
VNVGSLFSGVGGLDEGLRRAGHDHVFFCEADPYRRDVLAAHFPGVPVHDDVRTLAASYAVDLLCGGFPCQDLSVAGRRRGLAGERSGLFHEFARIADAIRPRWLLIENVPGLLSSHRGRDFGVLLATLADLGYGVAWRILDSRFFGVPQRRRRVFIVGTLAAGDPRTAAGRAGEILGISSLCEQHPPTRRKEGPEIAGTLGARSSGGRSSDLDVQGAYVAHALSKPGKGRAPDTEDYLPTEDGVRRLMPVECERLQGFPDGWTQLGDTSDTRRYNALGDAVTVTVAEWIGTRLAKLDNNNPRRDP